MADRYQLSYRDQIVRKAFSLEFIPQRRSYRDEAEWNLLFLKETQKESGWFANVNMTRLVLSVKVGAGGTKEWNSSEHLTVYIKQGQRSTQ